MHRGRGGGSPVVGWDQLGGGGKCPSILGRFEQFQCCLFLTINDKKLPN